MSIGWSSMGDEASLAGNRKLRSFYYGKKVLVAGGEGFLGYNCVRVLLQLGADVSVLTRSSRRPDLRPLAHVVIGDLRDRELMRELTSDTRVVFDFAGIAGAVDSNQEPERNLDGECRAHLTLFRACAESPIKPRVVFCSSRLVYGRPQYVPVNESHPLAPQSIYATHKVTAENYLGVFARTHGLPFTILRVSNPYGPYQAQHSKSYGVINQFLSLAAQGEAIRVYGTGSQLRDYIFVDDVVAAFLLTAAEEACAGECFNLGGRRGIRLGDAARAIARLADGPPVEVVEWPDDYQAVETGDYLTDLGKIDSYISLPVQKSFEAGVTRSLDAYREEFAEVYAVSKVS